MVKKRYSDIKYNSYETIIVLLCPYKFYNQNDGTFHNHKLMLYFHAIFDVLMLGTCLNCSVELRHNQFQVTKHATLV